MVLQQMAYDEILPKDKFGRQLVRNARGKIVAMDRKHAKDAEPGTCPECGHQFSQGEMEDLLEGMEPESSENTQEYYGRDRARYQNDARNGKVRQDARGRYHRTAKDFDLDELTTTGRANRDLNDRDVLPRQEGGEDRRRRAMDSKQRISAGEAFGSSRITLM